MKTRTVYLTPSIASPLSSREHAPIGAVVNELAAIEVGGETYVLHPSWQGPVTLDDAPEAETNKRIRRAIAKELPTRGEREAAGLLTEEDLEDMATETAEQQAAAKAAWEAELTARLSPGARAKREARENGGDR
jgi:hypothetical protein